MGFSAASESKRKRRRGRGSWKEVARLVDEVRGEEEVG